VSPGTVSFTSANWNTPQTVTVNAVDDSVVEGPHAATISHGVSSSDPNYSGFVLPAINVAITDNDSAVVNFSAASVSQSEGTSPMAYTVTLSNPVQSGVTLTLNSTNGTAGAADYTPISGGTVSFAANSNTSQTVNVIVNNDALDEDDETYSLTLSGLTATGNVTLAAGQRAYMQITKSLGTTVASASGLNVYPCYQLSGGGVLTTQGGGIFGLTVLGTQRIMLDMNYVYSGLAAGTYAIGMCGASAAGAANWNNNEWGYISALVF